MAYGVARHDVVLFGGTAKTGLTASSPEAPAHDTWTWNGKTWQQQHPQHAPAFVAAWPATMGFDPASRYMLLYGFSTNYVPQTWAWNGADWTQLNPSSSPEGGGFMFNDGRSLYVVAPSTTPVLGRYPNQTWRWDGSSWRLLTLKSDLPRPGALGGAYDEKRSDLVVFNGDTWIWDGATWTRQHPLQQPTSIGYMAYFRPLNEVVMWGDSGGNQSNDTWAWDGTNWKLIQAGTAHPTTSNGGK